MASIRDGSLPDSQRSIEVAIVKIADVHQVPPGRGKVVRVGGKVIALFNINGTFYAMDNVCTHRGGPLGRERLMER